MARIKLQYVQEFTDRHGRVHRYFRRAGFKRVPLPGLPGSTEFLAAYQGALDMAEPVAIGARRTMPGTIAALVVAYFNSADFRSALAPATQRYRRNIIEKFRAQHGDKRVALLQRDHIVRMAAAIERPHARKSWLKAIRGLMAYAVTVGLRADDPTQGVKLGRVKASAGHRTWSEEDIAAFRARHAVGSTARLALELMLGTGQRRSDVIRMGRQHVRDGVIVVRQQKTGAALEIPISPELHAVIDATPADHLTFLVTSAGKPFSAAGFGNYFRERCDEAGLPKCSAHGLRKAACRRLAEAGCSASEIAAISGHKSLSEVQRYCAAADQARMARAAMARSGAAFGAGTGTSGVKPARPKLSNRP